MADQNDGYQDTPNSTTVNFRDSIESYHDNPSIASIATNTPLLYTSFNGPDGANALCGHIDNEDSGCRMEKSSSQPAKKLWIAIVISLTFFTIELVGGLIAASLALLSDSFHLLSDVVSFGISLLSIYLAQRPATRALSYGYHRAEILGALVSIFLIWLLTLYLCVEAYDRLKNPVQVDGKTMCIVATIGVFVNIVLMLVLGHNHGHGHSHHGHKHQGHTRAEENGDAMLQEHGQTEHEHGNGDKEENVNIRAALLHVLGDFLSSLGVLISSIVIMFDQSKVWVDPICTFIFSALVMLTTYGVLRSSIRVLMEATPLHIDSSAVKSDLEKIKGVKSVHDLHIWDLTVGRTTLTAHIQLHKYDPDVQVDPIVPNDVLQLARNVLKRKYNISHVTIQIE
ncbi:cation efflux protein [Gigaspora margarita]|uniref:Cation efflux protein n=1 Tax=Gigaspora margarita TaxID=4874 RepID=A0A8H3X660_GIGMA|nr:cation efflux protein [Gigaspora margarita]